jgi:hypothetical protein
MYLKGYLTRKNFFSNVFGGYITRKKCFSNVFESNITKKNFSFAKRQAFQKEKMQDILAKLMHEFSQISLLEMVTVSFFISYATEQTLAKEKKKQRVPK